MNGHLVSLASVGPLEVNAEAQIVGIGSEFPEHVSTCNNTGSDHKMAATRLNQTAMHLRMTQR